MTEVSVIEVPVERIDALCREIADSYDAEGRGFALVKIAGGWRFESRAELDTNPEAASRWQRMRKDFEEQSR